MTFSFPIAWQAPSARCGFLVLALGLLPLSSGCGLATYEAKLAGEQKRMDELDRTENSLGKPLQLPEKEVNAVGQVFVRPPRGIAATPDDVKYKSFFYRYPRASTSSQPSVAPAPPTPTGTTSPLPTGSTPTAPAAKTGDLGFCEVYLAVGVDVSLASFRQTILQTFPTAASTIAKKIETPGRDPLVFDAWTDTSDAQVKEMVYLYQNGKYLVAIVYRFEKDKANAEGDRVIEASLRTLTVGPRATEMLKNFQSRTSQN